MSNPKEPHYFSNDEKYNNGYAYDAIFPSEANEYTYFGESSTTYSVWEPALARIKKDMVNPKLIVIVRDPVERLLSHYRWMYALGAERKSLRVALDVERKSLYSPLLSRKGCYAWYRRCSYYSYFIPVMQALFDPENVLLLKSNDLRMNPQQVLNRCVDFLGLDKFDIGNKVVRANETADKRVPRLDGVGKCFSKLPQGMHHILAGPKYLIKGLLGERKLVAPEPSDALLAEILELLSDDVKFYESI
jgi:hypothetical protein